jgi:hypothetical protein
MANHQKLQKMQQLSLEQSDAALFLSSNNLQPER